MHLHNVAGLFFNQPLLLQRSVADMVGGYLYARLVDTNAGRLQASQFPEGQRMRAGDDGRPVPYRVTAAGVAIITIVGKLVHRGAWMNAESGLVSYEGVREQLIAAVNDVRVRKILLDIESGGGAATGCMELAALIRSINELKPVVAVVNGVAASGGYAIASAARAIVSIDSGITGSIGVAMVHFDFSKYLEMQGIKPTLIFIGAHKGDGNEFEVLPESVRDDLRRDGTIMYDQFVAAVAAGRKGLSEKAIRATEAAVYRGREAVDVGLVDEIGTLEEVLLEMSA